jgi:outer membrane protein OmpA-like peptidoglycan-associated protein
MAADLVDMLQTALNETFTPGVAKHLGEPEATTRAGVSAAVPALLTGLLRQASTPSGAPELQRLVTDPALDADLTRHIAAWLDDGPRTAGLLSQGSALLSWLFGGRTGSVAEAVGAASGMAISSASTLLSLSAPAVLALLKRYLSQNRIGPDRLAGLLAGQRDTLRAYVDERLSSALGFASPAALLFGPGSVVSGRAAAVADASAAPIARRSWLWGTLALVAMALIAFFSYWTAPVEQTVQTAQNLVSTVGSAVKSLDLPGGMKLNVTAGGFVDTLTTFLDSKDVTLNRSFTFDELQFDPGSANLSPVSNTQLQQLAAVLRAYRTVLISVAGHTDNTGDPIENQRLSAERAAAVKEALVGQGVPAARVTDEGYGADRPIASNETEVGRARNRRVELVVLKR